MTRAKRRWAAGIYLSSMLLTIIVAFTMGNRSGSSILILLCVFVQWCALIWYIASYIPFGQKMLTKLLGSATNF